MKGNSSEYKLALWLSWIIAVILILLPFHALFTTWAGSNFGHLDLIRIWKDVLVVALVTPGLWLAWRSKPLRQWLMCSWVLRLFIAYALIHLALGIWAVLGQKVNHSAIAYSFIINLRFVAFFLLCAIVASQNDFLKRQWPKILLLPASVVITFGLVQKFLLPYDFLRHFGYGPDTIPAYQTVDSRLDYRRIQSTSRGANPLGAYLTLIIPALVIVLRKNRIIQLAALGAAALALFFSYSRSAWVGTAIALGMLAWWAGGQKSRQRLLLPILAILVLSSFAGLYYLRANSVAQNTLFHTSSVSSAKSSNDVRLQALETAAKDIVHEPVGRGPGTAGPASSRNDKPPRIAENYYLQIGQEVGIIGMMIFAAINIIVGIQLWRKRTEVLPRILLASLIGITFINLVSHAWTDDTLAYLWWGLAGVACAPAILESRHKRNG